MSTLYEETIESSIQHTRKQPQNHKATKGARNLSYDGIDTLSGKSSDSIPLNS